MSRPTVYTVHAYRYGDRELHSYSVGVFAKKAAALKCAEFERDYRGHKYECEILEWSMDSDINKAQPKTILALPEVNTLKAQFAGVEFTSARAKR